MLGWGGNICAHQTMALSEEVVMQDDEFLCVARTLGASSS